jgi:pyruvate formate lyase activating enzyme
MKEAYLYQKLPDKKTRCLNCAHYCLIDEGKEGICGVRRNIDGKLYSLVFGKCCALNIDPIEKKPFFHFLPGTYSLSFATVGCNFRCRACQNWEISQAPRLTGEIQGEEITPEEIIKTAKEHKVPSISYTYTEPAVFSEYALETMKLAKREGLKNNWVTNGFWSEELFNLISPYLDAVNVDLKSFEDGFYVRYCDGRLEPVLETLKRLKRAKIWTEVTTLVIPTLNDKEEIFEKIAQFIKNELDENTPWHISRFSGYISWQLKHLPDTPIETLQKAYQIGKNIGLKYVYTGNVPGLDSENTFCPSCNTLVVDRFGYTVKRYDKNGNCPKCNSFLNIIDK